MWICMKCDARVEPSFDVCWRCGTTYNGEPDPSFETADEAGPIADPNDYLKFDVDKKTEVEEELPPPPLELLPCFESTDLMTVQFVANELNAAGIPARLQNTHAGIPASSGIQYPAQVVVRSEDEPRARAWVDQFRKHRREAEGQCHPARD